MTYKIHTEVCGEWKNYSHIIEDVRTKKAIIIDPAWDAIRILERILENNLVIDRILLTHAHFDHVNAISDLKDKYLAESGEDIDTYLHQDELYFLKDMFEKQQNIQIPFGKIPENTKALHDCDKILLGDTNIEVIHTPGHSLGSCCFLLDNDLITGDTIFLSCVGRTDLLGSNPEDLTKSLQKIVSNVSHNIILHTGHAYGKQETDTLKNQIQHNKDLSQAISQII